jgi:polyisoprenoid-binding protein YceI
MKENLMRVFSLILAAVLVAPLTTLAAENYKIDPIHGTVVYRITHLNVGNAYGRFNEPTGMILYDKENPSNSTFTFEVQTAKVDTANPKRDQHLQSPDFFDAKQFPTISFKSTKVEGSGDDFKITGDLTLHGVTKSITVNTKKTGESQTQMGYRTGWEATHDLKRSDYGMTGLQGAVGDDVHLVISFEAVKQ